MIRFFTFLILFSISTISYAQKGVTAIVVAFKPEVELLKDSLKNRQEEVVGGITFWKGNLKGKPVVLSMTGVGKTNAAMTITLLISHFNPREIIFSGIAGGINPDLQPGDIVIAKATIYHDYGRIDSLGFHLRPTRKPVSDEFNPASFLADSLLLSKAQKVAYLIDYQRVSLSERKPKVITGIVATGDVFVNSTTKSEEIRQQTNADATEMEGAAVAQVCLNLNVPCLIIRSISDKANNRAYQDEQLFQRVAAINSANLVLAILQQ